MIKSKNTEGKNETHSHLVKLAASKTVEQKSMLIKLVIAEAFALSSAELIAIDEELVNTIDLPK